MLRCSDFMTRSVVKSLTILLLPISFVVGCGIFCLRVYFWVSNANSRGNKYLCYYCCCCVFVVSSFIYLSCVCICCMLVSSLKILLKFIGVD